MPHRGAYPYLPSVVRFGFRVPWLRKRLSATTSLRRYVRNNLGLKAPRGWGWLTNPRKAAYNPVYNRTTRGCLIIVVFMGLAISAGILGLCAVYAGG